MVERHRYRVSHWISRERVHTTGRKNPFVTASNSPSHITHPRWVRIQAIPCHTRKCPSHTAYNCEDASQLHSALPPNLDKSQAIFIPINDGKPNIANSGSHWSLLVYLRATSAFYYYDSLHNTNIMSARLTARRLTPLLGLGYYPQFISMWTPAQPNGADCGVYVIAITDFLVDRILSVRGARVNPGLLMQISPGDLPPTRKVRKGLKTMAKKISSK